jgi:ABC-type sulfate transport system substrate-binding protein
MRRLILTGIIAVTLGGCDESSTLHADKALLNASYEPTRRFYSAVNKAFDEHRESQNSARITIYQSHAGSRTSGGYREVYWGAATLILSHACQNTAASGLFRDPEAA